MKRTFEKIKLSERDITNSEQFIKVIDNEQNYVANMLSINLGLEKKEDSIVIYKAFWSNVPMPPNSARPIVTKQKEINLENLPTAIKENIYSIVDSILYSKELY